MNVAQRRASHVPWSSARCAQASPAAPRAIAAATVVAFGRRSMNADAARASDIGSALDAHLAEALLQRAELAFAAASLQGAGVDGGFYARAVGGDRLRAVGKRQFPKLGEYYAKMLAHCPQAITAYGACIKAAIDAGALEQGCCEREFSALKKCFREVRVKR